MTVSRSIQFIRHFTTLNVRQSPITIGVSYHSHNVVAEQFRLTMSRMASPAMILTSAIPMSNTPDAETTTTAATTSLPLSPRSQLHGMTLGSVCSLSVYPRPLLQFNLHLPSYTSVNLHEYGYLALHLMPPTHQGAYLSRVFARGVKVDTRGKKWRPDEDAQVEEDGEVFHEMTLPFRDLTLDKDYKFLEMLEAKVEVPVLNEAEVVMLCKCQRNFQVDQHEIWIVEVLQIVNNGNRGKSGGLLYFNRGFHMIGEGISEDLRNADHRK
ncbi:hypothetical protein KGF56_003469 [Candida oxycetoniae]|uniref:Flavin reductase like domain-containing protein n=1 Tax=Candida oxycetoniae TaxID=497107 RepID=A0AAI9WX86_9ASCO|nr:uncharacterized protein KGF56_003469 [Candida oxycetoniae]KAI3403744.2 hypothetical protein KGF56_003469 [Candida oxycetoniae]